MKLKSAFLILSIALIQSIFAQKLTKQFIDSTLKRTDSSYQTKRGVLYIVNGIPYDSLDIEAVVNKFELNRLISLHLLNHETLAETLPHLQKDVAIINVAFHQKIKNKRKKWRVVKELLRSNNFCSEFYIDNVIVDTDEIKRSFKSLRFNKVYYIWIERKEKVVQLIKMWTMHV